MGNGYGPEGFEGVGDVCATTRYVCTAGTIRVNCSSSGGKAYGRAVAQRDPHVETQLVVHEVRWDVAGGLRGGDAGVQKCPERFVRRLAFLKCLF